MIRLLFFISVAMTAFYLVSALLTLLPGGAAT